MANGGIPFTKRKEVPLSLWIIALTYFVAAGIIFSLPLRIIIATFTRNPLGEAWAAFVLGGMVLLIPGALLVGLGILCVLAGRAILKQKQWSLAVTKVFSIVAFVFALLVLPVFIHPFSPRPLGLGPFPQAALWLGGLGLLAWIIWCAFRNNTKELFS
jgi:hypothetical protein